MIGKQALLDSSSHLSLEHLHGIAIDEIELAGVRRQPRFVVMAVWLLGLALLPCLQRVHAQRHHGQNWWPGKRFVSTNVHGTSLNYTQYGPVAPGYLFVEPITFNDAINGAQILANDGELVWKSTFFDPGNNLDVQSLNGSQVLTSWSGTGVNDGFGNGYGAVLILDNTYRQLYNICAADLNIIYVPAALEHLTQPCKLDLHESRITPNNTLLATVRNITQADLSAYGGLSDGWVMDSLFVEIDIATQEILMMWSAVEHNDQLNFFEITDLPVPINGANTATNAWDFFHMNSVDYVLPPQEGYLISCRFCSSVIKLDKAGNIEWFVKGANTTHAGGNFTLSESPMFRWQHDAVVYNATESGLEVSLYDNNNDIWNDSNTPLSSGVFFHVDLTSKQVNLTRRYSPRQYISAWATGSTSLLPGGHVFVDYGYPPIVNEFAANGTLVYEAQFGDQAAHSYRGYRREWVGLPHEPPNVYANITGKTTDVWVSWNGATEVAYWNIRGNVALLPAETCAHLIVEARSPCDGTDPGVNVTKTTFETHVVLNQSFACINALAYDARNAFLGSTGFEPVHGFKV